MKKFIFFFLMILFGFFPNLVKGMNEDEGAGIEKPRRASERKVPIAKKKTFVQKRQIPEQEKERGREPSKRAKKKESVSEEKTHKKISVPAVSFVTEDDVELIPGKGSRQSGGGPGGHYWNIFATGKRAGKVFINWINEEPLGEHASLQIYLNKASQGKHIGRHAYKMACELSQYDEVYAYMSKKNLGSIRAARVAGFVQIMANTTAQVLMQWTRKKKE